MRGAVRVGLALAAASLVIVPALTYTPSPTASTSCIILLLLAGTHLGLLTAVLGMLRFDEVLERWHGWRRRAAGGVVPASRRPQRGRPGWVETTRVGGRGSYRRGVQCSNREVADRLFIAAKTVAVRVSNILNKTGSSSWPAVEAWARRSAVLGQPRVAHPPQTRTHRERKARGASEKGVGASLRTPSDQSDRAGKRRACERQQRENRRQGRAGAATSPGVNAGRHLDAADGAVVTGLLGRLV